MQLDIGTNGKWAGQDHSSYTRNRYVILPKSTQERARTKDCLRNGQPATWLRMGEGAAQIPIPRELYWLA